MQKTDSSDDIVQDFLRVDADGKVDEMKPKKKAYREELDEQNTPQKKGSSETMKSGVNTAKKSKQVFAKGPHAKDDGFHFEKKFYQFELFGTFEEGDVSMICNFFYTEKHSNRCAGESFKGIYVLE